MVVVTAELAKSDPGAVREIYRVLLLPSVRAHGMPAGVAGHHQLRVAAKPHFREKSPSKTCSTAPRTRSRARHPASRQVLNYPLTSNRCGKCKASVASIDAVCFGWRQVDRTLRACNAYSV
jgi:hypothetical protein